MSHDATNWAVKVRGISPAEARVLWHLADCHNPVFGCFPTQEYLAENCEMDERSIRRQLYSLRDKGHINWVEQREKNKRRANRYSLGFEPGFKAAERGENPDFEPDNLSGSTDAATGQDYTLEPDISDSLNRTQESAIEPVREPVREPVNEPVRERGSAREVSEDDLKQLEKRFDALRIGKRGNPWPGVLGSSKDWAFRQFLKLTAEERLMAEDRRDAYLAICPKVKSGENKGEPNPVALGVYLRDKIFNDVAAIAPRLIDRSRMAEQVHVAPFGPIWAGKRMLALLDGPKGVELPDDLRQTARNMFETMRRASESRAMAYLDRKGILLDGDTLVFPPDFEQAEYRRRATELGYPEVNRLHKLAAERAADRADACFQALSELCEAVPVGGEVFEEWRTYHIERGWPLWPDTGAMRVVYFPKGGPLGLDNFELAARAALNMGQGDDDAA